jgi:dephospho-CoA kinase
MLRIGLTGGIASGKTEAATFFRNLGAEVVSADEVYRDLARPGGPILRAIEAEFGPGILSAGGALDRKKLSAMVFGDPEELARLDAVVRPPLVAAVLARVEELERERPEGVVVVEAAVLLEWDILDLFDVVVVVRAPRDVRVERLRKAGLSETQALARIASQASEEAYVGAADVIIENDSSLAELGTRILGLWRSLRGMKGGRAR